LPLLFQKLNHALFFGDKVVKKSSLSVKELGYNLLLWERRKAESKISNLRRVNSRIANSS